MVSKKMKKMTKKALLTVTAIAITTANAPITFAKRGFTGEYRQGEILSFGSDLNKKEELALREHFGVSEEMKAIYVDNAITIEQLGLEPNALDNYTGGWYSSAYVKLTNKGGVQVTSSNVNLVTNEMFANALITSGILNCEVKVSAPFMVTGESALAGILAGAEEIMGESLSEENKVVAKEEIDTTLDIADEILNNKDNEINNSGDSSTIASGIINDIKQQVIKDSPNSTQIQEIIINVTNNYGVTLSEESQAQVLSLMEDVNELDIEYKDIKESMENIGENIYESLKEAGVKLKESGFFEKIGDFFSDLFENMWNGIKNFFSSIFGGSDEVIEETPEVELETETMDSDEVTDSELITEEPVAGEENSSDVVAGDETTDVTVEIETEMPSTDEVEEESVDGSMGEVENTEEVIDLPSGEETEEVIMVDGDESVSSEEVVE